MLLSDEEPTLETLDYTIRILLAVHQPFYISIKLNRYTLRQISWVADLLENSVNLAFAVGVEILSLSELARHKVAEIVKTAC